MNIYIWIYFLSAVIYLGIGSQTYFKATRMVANKLFMVITINLFFWSIFCMLMSASTDILNAAFYRHLTTFSWSFLYALILDFASRITRTTNTKIFPQFKHATKLLYIPAFICFFIYFTHPYETYSMVNIKSLWMLNKEANPSFIYNYYFTFYYLFYSIWSFILLINHFKKTKFARERLHTLRIMYSSLITLFISCILDTILPLFTNKYFPASLPITGLLVILSIWFSIGKHTVMSLSSSSIINQVSEIMKEGMIVLDENDNVIDINLFACEMLKINKNNPLDSNNILNAFTPDTLNMENSISNLSSVLINRNGKEIPILLTHTILRDKFEEKYASIIHFSDMTKIKEIEEKLIAEKASLEEKVYKRTKDLHDTNVILKKEILIRKNNENRIREIAYTDHLTNLPNRRKWQNTLDNAIKKNVPFAVLFIDLDGFKLVNDSFGHNTGDLLLIDTSNRLQSFVENTQSIARLGGDEFALMIRETKDFSLNNKNISSYCQQLLNTLSFPFLIHNEHIHVTASIGIARFPHDAKTSEQLLRISDIAMYEAKRLGKDCYAFYNQARSTQIKHDMQLTNDLYLALENQELDIHYQPLIQTNNEKIIGFEALLRWQHPLLGTIMPNQFIPLTEQTKLIKPIGLWVFRIACMQLKSWIKKYKHPFIMAINISYVQLEDPSIPEIFYSIVSELDIEPSSIQLEITETTMTNKNDIKNKHLQMLYEMGFLIAIDDFGSEYATFDHLQDISMQCIKIPKKFIDGINIRKHDESIILATIQLAKHLNLKVVAEGVETKEQFDFLRNNSCENIQGFYFHHPENFLKIESILDNFNKY